MNLRKTCMAAAAGLALTHTIPARAGEVTRMTQNFTRMATDMPKSICKEGDKVCLNLKNTLPQSVKKDLLSSIFPAKDCLAETPLSSALAFCVKISSIGLNF